MGDTTVLLVSLLPLPGILGFTLQIFCLANLSSLHADSFLEANKEAHCGFGLMINCTVSRLSSGATKSLCCQFLASGCLAIITLRPLPAWGQQIILLRATKSIPHNLCGNQSTPLQLPLLSEVAPFFFFLGNFHFRMHNSTTMAS